MNSNIPDEAVEAAESAVMTAMLERPGADGYVDGYREFARAALEAAAPHMLSHEREEAETVGKLQAKLDRVNAALFDLMYKWRNGGQVYYSDLEFIRKSLGDD